MQVPFEALSDEARVWIYPASRPFTDDECIEITTKINAFLTAGVRIPYNRFIVIALDESHQEATGCSIDASVKIIQEIETTYGVTLMDKMNVSFKQGAYITYKPLMDFKKMVKTKAVTENTIVFNNLVVNKEEFLTQWEVPAHQSWHSRYF